jgi:hypothetical protein
MAEQLRGPFEKFVDSPYYSVYVFEKWVERFKKWIAYQGRYFERRPSPHLHKVPTRSNKVSPGTFQTASSLRHPEKGSFKTTVTQILMTVRGMKITPLLRYPHHYNFA